MCFFFVCLKNNDSFGRTKIRKEKFHTVKQTPIGEDIYRAAYRYKHEGTGNSINWKIETSQLELKKKKESKIQ